ncbi:MAG: NlpC/P60 family protein [Sulfitobacter sp.]|nr:NlpC/P60 family protein [Sulfitobacter sp.]
MSDPRVTPEASRITQRTARRVAAPLADLLRRPEGPRDRQLTYGEAVTVLDERAGWAYVQAEKEGYCGYLRAETLGAALTPTHRVSASATHAYSAPDLKSAERCSLTFGARLAVMAVTTDFAETELGHIPLQHIAPVTSVETDPAGVAALFLGTPYLWGGNSRAGIDCSGLVQAALLACGLPCPGDSDQQMRVGKPASLPYQRNDLIFWKGHVAMVIDPETLIHANAHAMACTLEPIEAVIARIAETDGPVTAHRRL